MCFSRKSSLGRYIGTRDDWVKAYRDARRAAREGREKNPATGGVAWKAQLIVAFERGEHVDPLTASLPARMAAMKIINELLAESHRS